MKLFVSGSGSSDISRGGKAGVGFGDLQIGDRVRVALYDPATNRVLKLVAG